MKSLTFIRGVALAGALMLFAATPALAAVAPSHQAVQSGQALARSTGEDTPVHLSGTSTTTHASSSGGGASIVRTIVGLFIVIAVIYGIAWIMKQAKKSKHRPTGRGLTQVASLPLGSGRSVAVVRAGREVLVVGVAENGVTPIRSYSEAEAIALGIEVPPEKPEAADRAEKPSDRVLDVLRRITARS
ncbi:MAG TPA: flagellar biosynthetic protein FliO [Solirubrobacteraceae bacterium]|nr:flagellar biosynthetic protein FliO [Solirubrobacteraceae bacterium]